jgi:hypothetical protein
LRTRWQVVAHRRRKLVVGCVGHRPR